jgi:hypothetical protein
MCVFTTSVVLLNVVAPLESNGYYCFEMVDFEDDVNVVECYR